MSQKLLVAFDGSDPAKNALRYTLETFPKAEVTVLYVIDLPDESWKPFGDDEEAIDNPFFNRRTERAEEILDEATQIAADHDHEVDRSTEIGKPAREIVEFADSGQFDGIIIGNHGRKGAARVLLGSVAETVVRRSPLPVTTVR